MTEHTNLLKSENDVWIYKLIGAKAKFLISFAIILYLVAFILEQLYPPAVVSTASTGVISITTIQYIPILSGVIKFFATALIGFSFARLFFNLPETRRYFGNVFSVSITNLLERRLGEKEFIDNLSRTRLEELHYAIVKKSASIDFPISSSFYKTMRHDIEPLLGKSHINKLIINIDYAIEDGDHGKYIRKKQTTIKQCHLRGLGTKMFVGFSYLLLSRVHGFSDEELYSLKMDVDGKPVDISDILKGPFEQTAELIKFEVPYFLEAIEQEKFVTVTQREQTIIPINDSYRWNIASNTSVRGLSIDCTFNEAVHPELYVFGIQKSSKIYPAYSMIEPINEDNKCWINGWSGWMLPSHGIYIRWDMP